VNWSGFATTKSVNSTGCSGQLVAKLVGPFCMGKWQRTRRAERTVTLSNPSCFVRKL